MFEGSTITKANEANFSFTVPLTVEKDESIVIDLLSDLVGTAEAGITTQQLKSFDMYVQTGSSTFKVESCVVTSANFDISPNDQFKVEIAGQGTKLTRAGDESYSIPGSAQSESATRTPLLVYPVVSIDSLNMSSIISTTFQLQNSIDWTSFETLQNSLSVTDVSNLQFPSAYTVSNRIVSGAVKQYQTDNNITQFDDFSTSSNITIKAVRVGNPSSDSGFFQVQVDPAMFTARMETGETYTQNYDYRSLDSTAIGTRITQYS